MTYQVRGLIFQTRNELKAGWPEQTYHDILVHLLQQNRLAVRSKPHYTLTHRNSEIHTFEPDIIVENSLILELKILITKSQFAGEHFFQLINYLKSFQIPLGYLVNFAPARVRTKRVIWHEPPVKVVEQYDDIKSLLGNADRQILRQIRQIVLKIANQYGLGYHGAIYQRILAVEFEHNGLSCQTPVEIPVFWQDKVVGRQNITQLLVANQYLVHVRGLIPKPVTYDFISTKSYLENLGLQFGLIVNFSRRELQIYGLTTLSNHK